MAAGRLNPGAWLPDGHAYVAGVREGGAPSDIWSIPADGAAPTRLVGSPYDEHSPTVSADGRWLAYQSDETGRAEVYVRPLDGSGGRLQASNAGGREPVWDRRRSTLYYIEDSAEQLRLIAATISGSPRLAVASRGTAVLRLRLEESENHSNYDVDPSGTRFVMLEREASRGLVAVFDWAASLRRVTGE